MDSALIVSCTEKSIAYLSEILNAASYTDIVASQSCGKARRMILEREFDLILINAPLHDESGESLSRHIASKGLSQVILVVKSEYSDAVSAVTEDYGVLVVAKPINKAVLWSALGLARAVGKRLTRIQAENSKLKQKIEDIRVIDRAKCILISYLNMSEQEAHRYIEKQAMDMRQTKRTVAEGILKTYEN